MSNYRYFCIIAALGVLSYAAVAKAASNICNETVPTNRFVDGFPAYSQCDASTNSAIWSDDGINTSTTSGGTGWTLTQMSGGYQCTEFAFRYLYFKWKVRYMGGMAKDWCNGSLPSTLQKSTTPAHGDIIVFSPGSCGADATTGHVAVVDAVDTSKSAVTIVEQNRAGRRSCAISTAQCFLHVTANTGETSDAGTRDAAVGTAGTGGSIGAGGAAGSSGRAGSGGRTGAAGGAAGRGALGGSGAVGGTRPAAGGNGAPIGGLATNVTTTAAGGATGIVGMAGQAGWPGLNAMPSATEASVGCSCDLSSRNGPKGSALVLVLIAIAPLAASRRRIRVSKRPPPV